VTSGKATILVFVAALASFASAQDRDSFRDDPGDKNGNLFRRSSNEPLREAPPREAPPPSTYDPNDEAPPPDATPQPTAPRAPAEPGAPPPGESPGKPDEISVKANGRARLSLGYDSNVFRAERGAQGDGFFHGFGEAQVLVAFPEERELFASVSGEGITYFREKEANETYGSSFIDYYHPFSPLFDLDVQNTFEYSAQQLLDDNGDLLPRAKFNAYDEEVRATGILHLGARLSFELSGGARYKAFEDNPGLPSLSYWEARGSAGVR